MLQLIEISLICTGIHVSFMEGMIFDSWIKKIIEIILHTIIIIPVLFFTLIINFIGVGINYDFIQEKIYEWLIKPIYDCLPCMASVWTILIMREIDIKSIVIVCGMNAIIASVLQFFANSKLPE